MSWFVLVAVGFALGMVVGLTIGPSRETREAIRISGYLDGLRQRNCP